MSTKKLGLRKMTCRQKIHGNPCDANIEFFIILIKLWNIQIFTGYSPSYRKEVEISVELAWCLGKC